ncbi:DUF1707 domain-containing protein [Nocardioides sp.]|uniref:DUF1707 SHOCT-like domain-containing protein n=1 Tax=Nocardioides sp. TaxID=35761 RepID=UPI001A346073|nr:DUF1707 domain-containing protein [Nocardioides sp.]MBJ7359279.1 DUF1707 domain-containing protein [Nocardioides sp.]
MSDARIDSLRIGDAERERAAADLGEHFAQGRLTADEHAERLEQVWVAKTRAELAPLFRDLPGGTYGARPAGPPQRPAPSWRGRRWLPVPAFAAVPLLLVAAVLLHVPFLLFGVLALWFLSRGPWRHTRHGHWGHRGCR